LIILFLLLFLLPLVVYVQGIKNRKILKIDVEWLEIRIVVDYYYYVGPRG